MRELTAEESLKLDSVISTIGAEHVGKYIKIASNYARNKMNSLGKSTIGGMDCDDFAMEAFVYIASRGQDFNFIGRRAQLMVIDKLRCEYGRRNNRRKIRSFSPALENSILKSVNRERETLDIPDALPKLVREICLGLKMGQSRKHIAERVGITPARLTREIAKHRSVIMLAFT